jgi:hypothetical protein
VPLIDVVDDDDDDETVSPPPPTEEPAVIISSLCTNGRYVRHDAASSKRIQVS